MNHFKAQLVYWKLVIFKVIGKSLMAAVLSVVATLNGVQWSEFTNTQKFVAVATALGAMWAVLDAFLDQTISRLSTPKPAPPLLPVNPGEHDP